MCCLKNFKNKFVGRLTTWRYKCTTSDVRLTNFYSTKNSSLYPLVQKHKSILRCFCSMHYRFKKSFHLKPNKRHDNENQWPQMSNWIFEEKKEFQKYIMSSIFCQLFFYILGTPCGYLHTKLKINCSNNRIHLLPYYHYYLELMA